jgi:hypothetical protein
MSEKKIDKKQIKLFIATPAFGHMVTTSYMNSVMKFVSTTHPKLQVSTALHLQSGMALVTQARNNCVASFLQTDCTHFLFIDSDIGFEPEALFRLLEKDEDVVLTPYPVKGYGANGQLQFIVHFPDPQNVKLDKDGFIEITAGPTGFMMIKREVFAKLAKAYPDKKTVNKQLVGNKVETMDNNWYTFFETGVDPKNGYLGEDICFCKLWTDIGGKIYGDAKTALTHFGSHAYTGSLDMMFKPRVIDFPKKTK